MCGIIYSKVFCLCLLLVAAAVCHAASKFSATSGTNVVAYWGQNTVSNLGGSELNLAEYCNDDTIDIIVIGFIYQIRDGQPILNLANHCFSTFPGTSLLSCPQIGADIKTCQSRGKAVFISVGGAAGSYSLPDDQSGNAFAEQIWDKFLGGSSSTRPFGNAILDGVDLDLEGGQTAGYRAFVNSLRKKITSSSHKYYISAAPQCPFPDQSTGDALAHAWFDFVWVQFYNNYCGVQSFGSSNFNFDTWNNWANTVSINKNVKVLLGIPGGPGAAGSGIIGSSQLQTIVNSIRSFSHFGGVMMWDAGVSRQSGLARAAANILHGSVKKTAKKTRSKSRRHIKLDIADDDAYVPKIRSSQADVETNWIKQRYNPNVRAIATVADASSH
ncbi:Chitinase 1 [Entomortierella beljakovae]|nr:Chitinase 1 [Entomortierella beljakovae]